MISGPPVRLISAKGAKTPKCRVYLPAERAVTGEAFVFCGTCWLWLVNSRLPDGKQSSWIQNYFSSPAWRTALQVIERLSVFLTEGVITDVASETSQQARNASWAGTKPAFSIYPPT